MSGFYDNPDKLDYPAADRLVRRYIRECSDRNQTTSVDVLRWSEYPNDHHNRQRVYDTLGRHAHQTDENWAGRTVFQLPNETPEP